MSRDMFFTYNFYPLTKCIILYAITGSVEVAYIFNTNNKKTSQWVGSEILEWNAKEKYVIEFPAHIFTNRTHSPVCLLSDKSF